MNLLYRFSIHLCPTPSKNLVGIYEIPIYLNNGSTKFYIGKTKKKFLEHLKEYLIYIKYHNLSTVISRFYMHNISPIIDFENVKIIVLYSAKKFVKENLLKSLSEGERHATIVYHIILLEFVAECGQTDKWSLLSIHS